MEEVMFKQRPHVSICDSASMIYYIYLSAVEITALYIDHWKSSCLCYQWVWLFFWFPAVSNRRDAYR